MDKNIDIHKKDDDDQDNGLAGGDQEITEEKTKPKEEEASGTICKNTEGSTPPGLDVQHDNKPKKVQFKIIIDDMPESGSAGHIDILPDAIQKMKMMWTLVVIQLMLRMMMRIWRYHVPKLYISLLMLE